MLDRKVVRRVSLIISIEKGGAKPRIYTRSSANSDVVPYPYIRSNTSNSTFTMVPRPFQAAQIRDVCPCLTSLASTSAPASNSTFTTVSCPFQAAQIRDVPPYLTSLASTSAPASNSTFTTVSYPFSAAQIRDVCPYSTSLA